MNPSVHLSRAERARPACAVAAGWRVAGLAAAVAALPMAGQAADGQALAAPAVSYEIIHKVDGDDGFVPNGTPAIGPDGALYGTTGFGAAYSHGASFKITTSDRFKLLQAFGAPGTPQLSPRGALTLAGDGNFYGGGSGSGVDNHGAIYRMTPKGATTTLFDLDTSSCENPASDLALASDGKLYGITSSGGANGRGCIYSVSTDGVFTLLHSLSAAEGGVDSNSKLDVASDGYLYGTTAYGGSHGGGTLYRISTTGAYETLYSFVSTSQSPDQPVTPQPGLVEGPDGLLYGTSFSGGAEDSGLLFAITKDGSRLSVVHDFAKSGKGLHPTGQLMLGSDGQLYGATYKGSIRGPGHYYRVTLDGQYTKLHQADRELKESSALQGRMIETSPGVFYGTTGTGGKYTQGTVFKMQVN